MITIRQGDSYPIFITLNQDGYVLTPEIVQDIKVCIGESFHKTYSEGGLQFDPSRNQWYIWPTQEETLAMEEGRSTVCCHIKYHNGSVIAKDIDRVNVTPGCCEEAF